VFGGPGPSRGPRSRPSSSASAERKRLNLRDAGILLGIMLDKAELLAAQTGFGYGAAAPSPEAARDTLIRVLDAIEPRAAGDG
jgi:hypothetical protein